MDLSLTNRPKNRCDLPSDAGTVTEESRDLRSHLEVVDQVFTQLQFDRIYMEQNQQDTGTPQSDDQVKAPLILHVDDDVDLVDAVTSRFKASGFRVASALDGISGMHAALVHPADAIILDYDMPNGRGDKVIELLKANENTCKVPIVILTAVHKRSLKRRLLAQGADVFMTKPFDFEELENTVAQLIESKNEQ